MYSSFGPAMVDFALSNQVISIITDSNHQGDLFLRHDLWKNVVAWFQGKPLPASADFSKLSHRALGYLLARCPSTEAAMSFVGLIGARDPILILEEAEQRGVTEDKLVCFIQEACLDVKRMELPAESDMLSGYRYRAIFTALRNRSLESWPGVAPAKNAVKVPVECSPDLLKLFCDQFSDSKVGIFAANGNKNWDAHIRTVTSLLTKFGELAVLRHLSNAKSDFNFLVWLLWLRNPAELLPIVPASSAGDVCGEEMQVIRVRFEIFNLVVPC